MPASEVTGVHFSRKYSQIDEQIREKFMSMCRSIFQLLQFSIFSVNKEVFSSQTCFPYTSKKVYHQEETSLNTSSDRYYFSTHLPPNTRENF